jgi:serine/threonine protein kinase
MSPEMLRGKPADEQADLFAVGLVLYEIVVGKKLGNVAHGVTVMPSDLVPERSCRALDAVLVRALDPNPTSRFVSAEHFLDELTRLRRSFPALMLAQSSPRIDEIITVARPMVVPEQSGLKTWTLFLAAAVLSSLAAILLVSQLL